MNKCEVCGFLHYRTDPCRVAKKSTAARMDVRLDVGSDNANGQRLAPKAGIMGSNSILEAACTQAMPVDTNAERSSVVERSMVRNTGEAVGSTPTVRTKFNKTEYQRIYVAKWRKGLVGKKNIASVEQQKRPQGHE